MISPPYKTLSQRRTLPMISLATVYSLTAVLALTAVTGCDTDAPIDEDPLTEGGKFPADGEVNYFEHVKPIYKQRCNGCHQPGAVAPFALDDLKTARKWGAAAKYATGARTMPPFLLKADGTCADFQDSNWLSEDEIATIGKWVDANMPAGDPAKDPGATPKMADLEGAIEYEIPFDYTPVNDAGVGGAWDDYRCFPIEIKLEKDAFVTAVDVIPGEPELVHHVLAFAVSPNNISLQLPKLNKDVMGALDAKHNSRPGWPCYAAAGDGVLPGPMVIGWAPGSGATHYPKGTGLKVKKGDVLVVQMHYNVTGKAKPDRTKIRLKYADKVDHEAWFVLHDPFLFGGVFSGKVATLEPGKVEVPYTWKATRKQLEHTLPSAAETGDEVLVHGVFPHMHKRGRKMHMTVTQEGGDAQCMADVVKWDYNWQRMYYYDKPFVMNAKTQLSVTCTFDTSDTQTPVNAGFGTNDEMCLMGYFISKKPK